MENHYLTGHAKYRSWCSHCVAGRSDNPPHRRQDGDAPAIPEVHLDYAFVRRDEEEATTTVLIAKHRQSRAVRTWTVPRKGDYEAEPSKWGANANVTFQLHPNPIFPPPEKNRW